MEDTAKPRRRGPTPGAVNLELPQYRRGPRGDVDSRPGKRAWTLANPEKRRAHKAVEGALRRGDITRPAVCQRCGCDNRCIQAHHDDYGRPLDVMWLCTPCHYDRHDEIGKPMAGRSPKAATARRRAR